MGVKRDGTVIAAVDKEYGGCNVEKWRDIIAVCERDFTTIGIRSDGTIIDTRYIFCGSGTKTLSWKIF